MAFMLLAAVLVHPSHESLSEVEWNAETGRLEVALRFDALDEQWLRKQQPERSKRDDWSVQYLRSKYRIAEAPAAKQPDPTIYHWIGREEEGPHVWWYFEIEPRDHQPPKWLEVRVLFEREKNYTHQFIRLDRKPRYSKTLTVLTPRRPFNPGPQKTRADTPRAEQTVDGSNNTSFEATVDR